MRKSGKGKVSTKGSERKAERGPDLSHLWGLDIELVVVSDLHLSHTPPLARSTEEDWYGCMQRVLEEITEVKVVRNKNGVPLRDAHIVYPGDIFHTWNPPPELINFALSYLPEGYSIPGQHDLPNHSLEDIRKSAYWTLVKAEKIEHLDDSDQFNSDKYVGNVVLHGFPWGTEVKPLKRKKGDDSLHIAVIHAYCWRKGCSYPDASPESRVGEWKKKLEGYDYAFFGDNHIPFQYGNKDSCWIVNCGSMMRRNIDQLDHKPKCWLLLSDGKVVPHELDTSRDVMYDGRNLSDWTNPLSGKNLTQFVDHLKGMQGNFLDFNEAVVRYLDKHQVPEGEKKVILSALEESR